MRHGHTSDGNVKNGRFKLVRDKDWTKLAQDGVQLTFAHNIRQKVPACQEIWFVSSENVRRLGFVMLQHASVIQVQTQNLTVLCTVHFLLLDSYNHQLMSCIYLYNYI